MVNLTKRQEAVLYYILESKNKISIKKIASVYQVSERTIYYDIDHINAWLRQRGGNIKSNKYRGICFEGSNGERERALEDLFQNDVLKHAFQQSERREYLWCRILLSDASVTSEELSETLMVSRPTILADLRKIEEAAKKIGLSLEAKKGKGYWLQGPEKVFRKQITEVLAKLFLKGRISNYDRLFHELSGEISEKISDLQLALNYLRNSDASYIYEILNFLRNDEGVSISDADAFELFLNLTVQVRRLQRGLTVKKDDMIQIEEGMNSYRYILAKKICEHLEENQDICFTKYEINYTCLILIRCNVGNYIKSEEGQKERLEETIDYMLWKIKEGKQMCIQDNSLESLKADLYEYFSLLLNKKALKINSRNPVLAQIRAGYPELYQRAEMMAEYFREKEGVALTNDEIGTLTTYLAAYTEGKNRQEEYQAIIVCDEGKGLSLLLQNRIRNNIPDLKIKALLSVNELSQMKDFEKDIDFIISTVALPEISIPVFCVNPIISSVDIRNILGYMTENKTIGLVDEEQKRDNYLKYMLMGILTKYISIDQLKPIKQELDYVLSAQSGIISVENVIMIEEQYSYKIATAIAKITELAEEIRHNLEREIAAEVVIGLAIHIAMSIPRWEKQDFYVEKSVLQLEEKSQRLYRLIEHFLEQLSDILQYRIGKGEILPIMRYFE